MSLKFINLTVIILCLFLIQTQYLAEDFSPPLKKSNGLSSSFGEFRKTHLHAGIDIRTGGRIGAPVYAVDDGKIFRLAVKRLGFGNAVYIKHKGDIVTVYGHLDRFENEKLALYDVVEKEKRLKGLKYPGDIFVNIPVYKGQLIGYSGETGAGLPHLHFEVRKGESNPINPLGFISYNDNSPPRIQKLVMIPVNDKSFVNNSHEKCEIIVTKYKDNYKVKIEPVISGKIKLIASMYDNIGSYFKVGVHTFSTYLDGELLYKAEFDEMSYENWNKVGFLFDFEYTILGGRFYKLYRQKGNDLPIGAEFDYGSGIIDCNTISEGKHVLVIKATDANHNSRSCSLVFTSDNNGKLAISSIKTILAGEPLKPDKIYLKTYDNFALFFYKPFEKIKLSALLPDGSENILSDTILDMGMHYGESEFKRGISGNYEFKLSDNNKAVSSESLFIHSVLAGEEKIVTFESGTIYITSDSIYEDLFIYPEKITGSIPAKLPALTPVYKFNPVGSPFGKKAEISFVYSRNIPDEDSSRAGIYRLDRSSVSWVYVGSSIDHNKRKVSADITWLDIYSLLVDRALPVIFDVKPGYNSHIKNQYPVLFAKAKDFGSKIDIYSLVVTLDDEVVDAEFDPDRGWFSYKMERTVSKGKHVMKINIKDNAGNKAKEAVSLFYID